MVARGGVHAERVLAPGLADERVVDVPVQRGGGVGVRGAEDHAARRARQAARQHERQPRLRIDDLDGTARGRSGVELGMAGRQRFVVQVFLHVVPLLGRREHEAHLRAHLLRRTDGRIDLPASLRVQVHEPVVAAHVGPLRHVGHPEGVAVRAEVAGGKPALMADLQLRQPVRGTGEPAGARQGREDVEHHRRGVGNARHPGAALAVAVAHPDRHDPVGGDAHAPGVAVAPARAGLPGDAAARGEVHPGRLLLRPVGIRERVEGQIRGRPADGNAPLRQPRAPLAGQVGQGLVHRGARQFRREVVVSPSQRLQRDLRPAEDQRQTVMVGVPVDGREPEPPQVAEETLHPVLLQHPHGRDVERTRHHLAGRHGAVEGAPEVVRGEIVVVVRGILDQLGGQQLPGLQHRGIEQRLEGGAAGARRRDHVHVGAAHLRRTPARIAVIGPDLARADVRHEHAHVVHQVRAVHLEVPAGDRGHALLQRSVERGRERPVAPLAAAALQQVVGLVRHRQRPLRERLVLGQQALRPVNHPALRQLVQQRIALLQQALARAAGVDQAGGVGQHRQHGALAPGEVVGAAPEIAPRRRLQPHHVSAERRIGRVQEQDLLLGATQFQPLRQHHLVELLGQGAGRVRPAQPDHLHGQRAGPADDFAARQVLAQRAGRREQVHAAVQPEALVLIGHDAAGELLRHVVGRREVPLPVRRDARAEQRAVRRGRRGGQRGPEQLARQAAQKPGRQRCGEQYQQDFCNFVHP